MAYSQAFKGTYDKDQTAAEIEKVGVTTAALGALSITSAKLAANSVTTTKIADANVTAAKLDGSIAVVGTTEARTATATGATTGTITASNGNVFVPVTSDDANKIVILPAPVPGIVVTLLNGATGYELRSSAPATIGINGGVGVDAESAIPASTIVRMTCVSATNWIGETFTAAGVKGVVEVAA